MDKRKDRWANGWTHAEDSLLLEAVEATNNRDRKAWVYLCSLGVNRSFQAFYNRRKLLETKQLKDIQEHFNIPKGWGYYV